MRYFMVAAALATAHLCQAQVTWPQFNPPLKPGPANSPVAAVFPADVVIDTPDAGLDPQRTRWLGRWGGWACADAVCETKLAVEKVTSDSALIIYVFGSSSIRSNPQRVEAKFVGDELHGTLASGSRVAYRYRGDGSIDFLFLPRNGNPVGGVLSKEN